MPELLKSFIVRPAEQLTPKQIDKIGLSSHPYRLLSSRYNNWMELCEAEKYVELDQRMNAFMANSETITSLKQIPEALWKPIEFADYNGYKFDKNEFFKQISIKKLAHEFSKSEMTGKYEQESNFLKVYTNFADQLIAETRVPTNSLKGNLDKQNILKTLNLIERIIDEALESMIQNINNDPAWLAAVRDKAIKNDTSLEKQIYLDALWMLKEDSSVKDPNPDKFKINLDRLYEKPILLPPCIINIDPCKGIRIPPNPNTRSEMLNNENSVPSDGNQDDDCGCGKKKEENDCECKCDETCVDQDPCCAKIMPYIADLYVVKEEVSCYEVGEMSYIENVLQTEIRERIHRNLEREETTTEHEEETTSFEEKDLQVDERFSLQKEIDKTIEQTISIDAGVTAHQKWGTGDVTATTNFGFNQTKKDAQKSIQDSAKQVISKSITRLEKKIRDLTTHKLIKEVEEINKHVFGGTDGAPNDISRQFYFVNQVKRGQVYNYGRRSLLDFYLPEPSELYKRLIEKKFSQKKPDKPCIKIEEINPSDYLKYVQCYGFLDLKKLDAEPILIKILVSGENGPVTKNDNQFTVNDYKNFVVPDGYVATNLTIDGYSSTHRDEEFWSKVFIALGSANVYIEHTSGVNWWTADNSQLSHSLPSLEGNNTICITNWNTTTYNINLIIKCVINPKVILNWQLEVYKLIIEKYEKELAAYNEALAEFERTKQIKYKQNPFILLQDIQEQLKQAAISYISCQFFDDMDAMKNRVKDCGFPQMNIPETKREGEYVRFFEQAFEWKLMNFIFYPYFWSRKCSWENKMNEEADNMLFQRFLKAGFARVSVSVRRGFEAHVNYFLSTRKIWSNTGLPPITGPDFVPIYQEIKEDKDNFNTDREGFLDVKKGKNTIVLNGSDQYWDSLATPQAIDKDKIDFDINREIFINCKQYRIVEIKLNTAVSDQTSWIITLDRDYEGADAQNLPWTTGALFIGAPWEFKVPTRLVWLREKGGCLPCYPIKCEDKPIKSGDKL